MKPRLLIIGADGFIGSFLSEKLLTNCNVYKITKGSLDIFNLDVVSNYLKEFKFDIVINCLTFGGKKEVNVVDESIVFKNLNLFNNFLFNSDKFSHFVNIGSGSEFDSQKNIENAKEIDIFNSNPLYSYSYSKNIIARTIFYNNKFTTLRLFGCFGFHEPDMRLLKRYQSQQETKIIDRYFDYISINDFFTILSFVLKNKITSFDMNCVYENKIKLSTFLQTFDTVLNKKSAFTIDKLSELNYTGDCSKLSSLNLNLLGLEKSFKKIYG